MKYRNILFILLAGLVLSSCDRDEKSLFDTNTSTRVKQAITNAENALAAAPYGWEMLYFPNPESAGQNMLLSFKANGAVKVSAKNAATTAGKLQTDSLSTWEILSDYGPILTFNTYNNVLHAWADPQDDGDGFLGDYEFLILENGTTFFRLKGKKHSAYSTLNRLTEPTDEATYFNQIATMNKNIFGNGNLLYYQSGDLRLNLYLGSTGVFLIGADGQLYSIDDPEFEPVITTRTGVQLHAGIRGNSSAKVFTLNGDKLTNNAATITAQPYNRHFIEMMTLNSSRWNMDMTNINDSAKVLVEEITKVFKQYDSKGKAKYPKAEVKEMQILPGTNLAADQYLANFRYTTDGKNIATLPLLYTITRNGDAVNLRYDGPQNPTQAEKLLKANPKIVDLMNLLAGNYALSTTVSAVNPAIGLQITKTDNASHWFKLTGSAATAK